MVCYLMQEMVGTLTVRRLDLPLSGREAFAQNVTGMISSRERKRWVVVRLGTKPSWRACFIALEG